MNYTQLKRSVDILLGGFLLFCTLPLALLIAIFVKIDSPGAVLFRQQRVGKDNKIFTMLKFRSMYDGADTTRHQQYITREIRDNPSQILLKLTDDPRITKVGKFLRSTHLDELPQLINVFRGEMSLVGPRPPLPYEVAEYQDHHKCRLAVTPGITGLWQIKGRNRVSFEEMVQMDLLYIETMCFHLDFWILLRTPIEMMKPKEN